MLEGVRLSEDGAAIGWGETDSMDVAATTVERLAEETMSPIEFRAWLDRHVGKEDRREIDDIGLAAPRSRAHVTSTS